MGMFDSYDNGCITSSEHPFNVVYKSFDPTLPKEMYDINCNFEGYAWASDDKFLWEIDINKKVNVPSDSIVYDEAGQAPTLETEGYKGKHAYNVVDWVSWTCVGLVDGYFIWIQDDSIIYQANGDKEIEFIYDLTNAQVSVTVCNEKFEALKEITGIQQSTFTLGIGTEITEMSAKGNYFIIIRLESDTTNQVLKAFPIIVL